MVAEEVKAVLVEPVVKAVLEVLEVKDLITKVMVTVLPMTTGRIGLVHALV